MAAPELKAGFHQPHREAAELIARKPAVSRRVFDRLLPELKARAFTVTGIEDANALQRIRDSIASLPMGVTWDEVKGEVVEQLDLWFDEATAHRRATLLLRTHGFQAFQASHWGLAQEDPDTTHLQYLATEDSRVRATHLALNGVTLPKSDPFWRLHYPPWEWGCRCRVILMNPDHVDMERETDVDKPPEDRNVIDGPVLDQLRHGTLMRNGQRFDVTPPSERAADDQKNVYQWHPDNLRIPLEQLRENYDPEVWTGFRAWAEGEEIEPGVSVWQWLDGDQLQVPQSPTHPLEPTVTQRTFTKWKSLEEAAMGMPDAGIQTVGIGANALERLSFGREIGKTKQLKHANDVAEVCHSLKGRFPTLPDDAVKKLMLTNPGGRAAGLATTRSGSVPARMAIKSKAFHEQKRAAWSAAAAERAMNGRPKWSVSNTFDGTVRHELGHCLTQARHEQAIAMARATKFQGEPASLWIERNISEYASTNDKETLAEAFCLYTEPDYNRGTLPEWLEKILRDMLGERTGETL